MLDALTLSPLSFVSQKPGEKKPGFWAAMMQGLSQPRVSPTKDKGQMTSDK